MDSLTGLLEGPRARSAFVLRMVMTAPWAVRIQDRAPLTLAAPVSGSFVFVQGDRVQRLLPGQIALVQGLDPYVLADDAGTRPEIVVHPGNRCEDLHGRPLEEALSRGVRTWGNDPDGETVVLVGTYERLSEIGRSLLATLPPVIVVERTEVGAAVDLLGSEIASDAPGQGVVLDRLLDLVTVSALRAWFARSDVDAPGWWRAADDPVVGPALGLLHHNPAQAWTVASLASEVGVSRAGLAKRFTDLVGRPPMAYLTEWRLALAADWLLEDGATVAGVAARVGYGSGFALSAAFKRHRGCSPSRYRAEAAA